jgi:hypothetical protein
MSKVNILSIIISTIKPYLTGCPKRTRWEHSCQIGTYIYLSGMMGKISEIWHDGKNDKSHAMGK